jgi:hypothetical protein
MAELIKEIDKVRGGVELPAPVIELDAEEDAKDFDALRPSRLKRVSVVLLGLAILGGAGYGVAHLANEPAPAKAAPSAVAPSAPLPAFKDRDEPEAPAPSKDVALVLFPLDAHAWVDGKDLGQMPVSVKVTAGKVVELKVVRDGFYSRKLKLDGKDGRVKVILAKRDASKPPPPDALDDKGGASESPPEKAPRDNERPPEREPEVAAPKAAAPGAAQ